MSCNRDLLSIVGDQKQKNRSQHINKQNSQLNQQNSSRNRIQNWINQNKIFQRYSLNLKPINETQQNKKIILSYLLFFVEFEDNHEKKDFIKFAKEKMKQCLKHNQQYKNAKKKRNSPQFKFLDDQCVLFYFAETVYTNKFRKELIEEYQQGCFYQFDISGHKLDILESYKDAQTILLDNKKIASKEMSSSGEEEEQQTASFGDPSKKIKPNNDNTTDQGIIRENVSNPAPSDEIEQPAENQNPAIQQNLSSFAQNPSRWQLSSDRLFQPQIEERLQIQNRLEIKPQKQQNSSENQLQSGQKSRLQHFDVAQFMLQIQKSYENNTDRFKKVFKTKNKKIYLRVRDLETVTSKSAQFAPAIFDFYMQLIIQDQPYSTHQELIEYIPSHQLENAIKCQPKQQYDPNNKDDMTTREHTIPKIKKLVHQATHDGKEPVLGILLILEQDKQFLVRWNLTLGQAKIYHAANSSFEGNRDSIANKINIFQQFIEPYIQQQYKALYSIEYISEDYSQVQTYEQGIKSLIHFEKCLLKLEGNSILKSNNSFDSVTQLLTFFYEKFGHYKMPNSDEMEV